MSSEDADKSKPHPDIFLAAAQRLGISPRDCIAVGDTPSDAEASLKAGMSVIGVLGGGFSEEQLRRRDARKPTKARPICFSDMTSLCSVMPSPRAAAQANGMNVSHAQALIKSMALPITRVPVHPNFEIPH